MAQPWKPLDLCMTSTKGPVTPSVFSQTQSGLSVLAFNATVVDSSKFIHLNWEQGGKGILGVLVLPDNVRDREEVTGFINYLQAIGFSNQDLMSHHPSKAESARVHFYSPLPLCQLTV